MNPNEYDDTRRLEQIERLLYDGTPSDDSIVNMLRRTIPVPRPQYTDTLEKELFPMNTEPNEYIPQKRKGRPFRFPLAAAAVVALVMVGSVAYVTATRRTITVYDEANFPESPTFVPWAVNDASFSSPEDAFLLTATAYVAEVTQTAVAMREEACGFCTTATSYVQGMTETAIALQATAAPENVASPENLVVLPMDKITMLDISTQMLMTVGSRLSLSISIDENAVLVTDQALIVDVLENGDYLLYVPSDVVPVVQWLLSTSAATNTTYLVVDVIGG